MLICSFDAIFECVSICLPFPEPKQKEVINLMKKNVTFNWKSASIVDIINCLEFNNKLIALCRSH